MSTEFTCVILAATCGARLYPLTSSTDDEINDENFGDYLDDPQELQEQQKLQDQKLPQTQGRYELYRPKHLLPLAGKPILHHLIHHCLGVGMDRIILAISKDDTVTKTSLTESMGCKEILSSPLSLMIGENLNYEDGNNMNEGEEEKKEKEKEKENGNEYFTKCEMLYHNMYITLVTLPSQCGGSADALRLIHKEGFIPNNSHVMVLPADLVLFSYLRDTSFNVQASGVESNVLGTLADVHRREYRIGNEKKMPLAMSMLLADVGEEDENGIPLKETAKAKKGGIAREEEDMEFIGLSTIENKNEPPTQRILFKMSKYNVDEDEFNTGSTPKLKIPKARMHSPINQIMIKTAWSDLHIFCFSPWTLKLLSVKGYMKDLGKDFVPFLISSQFHGLKKAFGRRKSENGSQDEGDTAIVEGLIEAFNEMKFDGKGNSGHSQFEDELGPTNGIGDDDHHFMVSAHVLTRSASKLSLRASTIQSYVYSCREVVSQAITSSKIFVNSFKDTSNRNIQHGSLSLPEGTVVNAKFKSIILPDTQFGEKVQVKSSTIGKGVSIGNRCRLNNVVVHDNVIIGENCVLQNSVFSRFTSIGDNCNLNDCQVKYKSIVHSGTKEKGESL